MGATNDGTELKQQADKLRECATQARTIARSLGPYLDDAVSRATPRGDDALSGFGGAPAGNPAIWLGPFADQCTQTLTQRQSKLAGMASALMADAARWENEAGRLEGEARAAKAARTAGSTTGGH